MQWVMVNGAFYCVTLSRPLSAEESSRMAGTALVSTATTIDGVTRALEHVVAMVIGDGPAATVLEVREAERALAEDVGGGPSARPPRRGDD